ncbi:MAG TPA: hypothetical protein VF147_03070 [Vicinamibacterales bacterium]
MARSWEEYERSPEQRERDLAARQLARQARVSREQMSTFDALRYIVGALCILAALIVGMLAVAGGWTLLVVIPLIVCGVALLT